MPGFDNFSSITSDYNFDTVEPRADNTMDTLSDSLGLREDFAQVTSSYFPWLSRSDNKENFCRYSEDFSNAEWNKSTYPVSESNGIITATASSARHGIYQVFTASSYEPGIPAPGQTYRAYVELEYINEQYIMIGDSGDSLWHTCTVDLVNGTVTNEYQASAEIISLGDGKFGVWLEYTRTNANNMSVITGFTNSSGNNSFPTYTPAGTEQFKLHKVLCQRVEADKEYIKVEGDAVQIRGANGHRVGQFFGGQVLVTSSDTTSKFFDADSKLFYIVLRTDRTSASNQDIFKDASTWWLLRVDTSDNLLFLNYDTAYDVATGSINPNELTIVRGRHENGFIYLATATDTTGFGAEWRAASGDTGSVAGILQLGANGTTSNFLYGAISRLITARQSVEIPLIEKMLLAEYFGPVDRKSEKHFLAQLTLKEKESPYGTKSFWISNTARHEDELYFGCPHLFGALADITGVGADMSALLPSDKQGNLVLHDERGIITFEKRMRDFLSKYTFENQVIDIYTFIKHPDFYGVSSDLVQECSAYVRSLDFDNGTLSLSLGGDNLSDTLCTKRITSDNFSSAPSSSLGSYLSLPFGNDTQLIPKRISADGDTTPDWAYATTFGVTFPIGGIQQYKTKDDDGNYINISSAASTTEVLAGNSFDGNQAGDAWTLDELERAELFTCPSGGRIITNFRFYLYYSSGAFEGEMTFKIYKNDNGKPGKEIGSAVGNFIDYQTSSGNHRYIDVWFSNPVPLDGDVDYFFAWSRRYSGTERFVPITSTVDTTDMVARSNSSVNPDVWYDISSTALWYWEMRGLVLTDDPNPSAGEVDESGLGHAFFTASQKQIGSESYQTITPLDDLDWIVEADGLEDSSSNTIGAGISTVMTKLVHMISLLYYIQNDSSITGLDVDTYNIETGIAVDWGVSIDGPASYRDAIMLLLRDSGTKLITRRNGDLALWRNDPGQSPAYLIEDSDTDGITASIELDGAIVNKARVAYQELKEPLPLEETQGVDRPKNFKYAKEVTVGTFADLDSLITDSQSIYSEKNPQDSYTELKCVPGTPALKVYLRAMFGQYADERMLLSCRLPYWRGNFREIEVGDIISLTHIDLPENEGTGSSLITKSPLLIPKRVCADFDGSANATLSVSDNAFVSFGNEDMMVSAWIKFNDLSANQAVLGKYTSTGNQREYLLYYDNSTDTILFTVSSNGSVTSSLDSLTDLNWKPVEGTEYLFFAWHDSVNNQLGLEVWDKDGLLVTGTVSYSSGIYDGTADLCLGSYNAGASAILDGVMGPSAIWRSILNSSERERYWNRGNALSFSELDATLRQETKERLITQAIGSDLDDSSFWNSTGGLTSNDGESLIEDTANSLHYVATTLIPVTNNKIYEITAKAKAIGDRKLRLSGWSLGLSLKADYTLTGDGSISGVSTGVLETSIESLGDGWYFCRLLVRAVADDPTNGPLVYILNAANAATYTGDGASGLQVQDVRMSETTRALEAFWNLTETGTNDRIDSSGSNDLTAGSAMADTVGFPDDGSDESSVVALVHPGNGQPYRRAGSVLARVVSKSPIFNIRTGEASLDLELREFKEGRG